jgi:transposase-like protein
VSYEEPFMSSVLRKVRRGKKRLGHDEVPTVSREAYEAMELNPKVQLIQDLTAIAMMHVTEVLQDEVRELAGLRYGRNEGIEAYRHGTNPGTVRLAGQKVPIRVPRVRCENGEIPLESYRKFHRSRGEVDETLLRRVLYGISCRNYEKAVESIPGAIGLSSSTVSRSFIEASASQLKAFQERDLSDEDYLALFLDGKSFADTVMVVAMGVTTDGRKRILGFVETTTENKTVLTEFLRSLLARGLDVSRGILAVIDGAKGLRAAVRAAFPKRALIGRCHWHKRENVVGYLPKGQQAGWRKRLQKAFDRPTLKEAQKELERLIDELEEINQSAAASLREGLEEILTLHRLGVFETIGYSFKTTNCLENVNGMVEERCAKVDHWKNSNQKQRWMVAALIDIEPRLRRVRGYRHLPKLRDAIQRELKLAPAVEETTMAA